MVLPSFRPRSQRLDLEGVARTGGLITLNRAILNASDTLLNGAESPFGCIARSHESHPGDPAKPLQGRLMALLPPMYTTNATGRRTHAAKPKSASLLKAEEKHAKFLKRMGVGDLRRKISVPAPEPPYARQSQKIPSMNGLTGKTAKPEPKVYSGQRQLLGIATMHKSNMVPVFADKPKDATEIAKMRR
jgi:hypothetical protein